MKKRALLAFLLSAWQPGLGQLYAGRALRALLFCSCFTGVVAVFFYGIFGRSFAGAVTFVVLVVAIRLSSAVDAVLLIRSASDSRRWFQRLYVCVPLGIALAIILVPLLASIQKLKSYYIPSGAMEPTLMVGDRLIADLDAYAAAPPGRGDVVIVHSPEDPTVELIKRVVAVGGDTIELRGKTLYLNGAAIDEPWVVHLDPVMASRDNPMNRRFSRDHMAPLAVPEGHLFLMGDNRDFSYDSRFIGTVPVASVHGAPLYVYWSPHRNRIGIKLDSYATAAQPDESSGTAAAGRFHPTRSGGRGRILQASQDPVTTRKEIARWFKNNPGAVSTTVRGVAAPEMVCRSSHARHRASTA